MSELSGQVSGVKEQRSGAPAEPLALAVRHLAVHIAGTEVLTDVSLSVARGGALGVVGESGSGKTMTTRALTGTLWRVRGQVSSGAVEIGDQDVTRMGERDWRRLRGRRIALVPQSSQSGLDPLMSVRHHMVETLRALGLSGSKDAATERARELLRDVGLDPSGGLLEAYAHQLSGGMRQRVMIALALAGDPEILIGDEPTTALDVTVQRGILETLARLRRDRGLTLVLVSHDLGVIEEVTDHVAIMYAGTTVETGPTRRVLSSPSHPYTEALIDARPSLAHTRRSQMRDVPGVPPQAGEYPNGCRFAPRCRHASDICTETPARLRSSAPGQRTACIKRADPSKTDVHEVGE